VRVLGLDEAGRGCVLGPLVVGGFCADETQLDAIKKAGATDSKALSAKKREALIEPLKLLGEPALRLVSAKQIDGGNINTLEEHAFASLIEEFRPDRVIIDCPVHPGGIANFIKRMQALVSYTPEWVVENKADLTYPVCGAASIFAKVTRDGLIRDMGDVGSGYPGDPKTVAWLKTFIDGKKPFPPGVRTRWGTIARLSQQELF
jgi:ribonuclease HII